MKQYYIIINNEQQGPFSLNELAELELTENTLVWKKGFESWVEAKTIDDIFDILKVTPPPLPKNLKSNSPKSLNVNLKFGSGKKIDLKKTILKEKNKIKIAKEIKVNIKLFYLSTFLITIYYITNVSKNNGFTALSYKYQYENTLFPIKNRNEAKQIHYKIINLGKKNETLIQKKMFSGYVNDDKIRLDYSVYDGKDFPTENLYKKTFFNFIKNYKMIVSSEPETYSKLYSEPLYTEGDIIKYHDVGLRGPEINSTRLAYDIVKYELTIQETLEKAFSLNIIKKCLNHLIYLFLSIISIRYLFYIIKNSRNWIIVKSKKDL